MIINAKNAIVGRLAAAAAKQALLGNAVDIVNCEQAVFSGQRENVLAKYKRARKLGGPFQGPFIPRQSNMLVKRIIRGMLPYKQFKGRTAYERIKCHVGVPQNLIGQKFEYVGKTADMLGTSQYVTVQDVCMHLGSKR